MSNKNRFGQRPAQTTGGAPSAEAKPQAFVMQKGKSFFTARGIIDEGKSISPRDFFHGGYSEEEAEIAFYNHVEAGFIVPEAAEEESVPAAQTNPGDETPAGTASSEAE